MTKDPLQELVEISEELGLYDMEYKTKDNIPSKTYHGIEEDEFGHAWTIGWEETDKPHPGFGGSMDIYGCYVDQCAKCGMYGYEFHSGTETPGKYEGQTCDKKVR